MVDVRRIANRVSTELRRRLVSVTVSSQAYRGLVITCKGKEYRIKGSLMVGIIEVETVVFGKNCIKYIDGDKDTSWIDVCEVMGYPRCMFI